MKAKEFIIEKMVKVGKNHRWMKYPMLALVSLVSLFFLLVEKCMEKPKRAVIALVCLVLIISQSWYLISMAGDGDSPLSGASTGEEMVVTGDSGEGASSSADASTDASSAATDTEASTPMLTAVQYYVIKYYDSDGTTLLHTDSKSESDLASYDLVDFFTYNTTVSSDCWTFNGWTTTNGDIGTAVSGTLTTANFDSTTYSLSLYANYTRTKYQVTYNLDGGTSSGFDNPYYVPIDKGAASMILSNPGITKTGYTFTYWKLNGSSSSLYEVGSNYDFATYNTDITLTPNWVANTYTIHFVDTNGATGSMDGMTVSYGTTVSLTACGYTRAGYSFAGWKDADGNEYAEAKQVSNLTATNGATITLYAQWIYDPAGFDRDTLEYEYSDTPNNDKINVYHDTVGDGTFDIKLTAVTLDDVDITSTYTSVTGLTVSTSTNYIAFSGDVATVGTAKFCFSITDKVNASEGTISKWVTVSLLQKELEVIDITTKTKTYDGNSGISIGTISYGYAGTGEATSISGIYVTNATQRGDFASKGSYVSGVGTNLDIYISGIRLNNTDPATDIAQYYSIASTVTLEGIGTITAARLTATPVASYSNHDGYIYTGEAASFDVTVEAEADFPSEVLKTDLASIKSAIAGHYICEYSQSNYSYEDDHTYSVTIDVASVNSVLTNYTISSGTGSLVVKHPVIEDTYYTITGDQLENSKWYYNKNLLDSSAAGATITAIDTTFDRIYIMNDPDDRAYTCTASTFAASALITEEKATTDTQSLYIQMGSSETGAVTPVKIITVYVDTTAPVMADTIGEGTDDIQITTETPSIGNFFKYGIFFKEKVVITVPVTDSLSGASTLTYSLTDSDSSEVVTEGTVSIQNDAASFEISPTFKGTVTLTAMDVAGNTSTMVLGVENSSLFVVENTSPKITVTPKDSEGNTVYSGNDVYYKSVTVTVGVKDEDAGIQYIEWNITKDGETIADSEAEYLPENYDGQLVTEYNGFTKSFTESGSYSLNVTAYDNAGNASSEMESILFIIDGTAPVITILTEDYDSVWATQKTIAFTATDSESGINLLTLKGPDGEILDLLTVEGEDDTYTFTVTEKGTYTISAVDKAGNQTNYPITFEKVSAEIPDNPVVTIAPELEVDASWYTTSPTITITEDEKTSDGTEIFTYYYLWKDGTEEPTYSYTRNTSPITLTEEGVWNLRVWAETESGVRNVYESEEDGLYQICYDGTAPVISDLSVTGSGTSSLISFSVTEEISGLAELNVIYNEDEDLTQSLSFNYAGNGVYTASFTSTMQGSYQITAIDAAGNKDVVDAFEPMSIQVTKIVGDAENGFTVLGQVTAGTYAIDSVTVTYGLKGEELNLEADECIIVTDDEGNKSFTAKFTQLSEDTNYQFEITALSTSGEVCSYTGAFKTGSSDAVGVNVAGTVTDETLDLDDDTTTISVMLYEGTSVLQTQTVTNGGTFVFSNVPDGVYVIRAVNGNRVATQGVVISGNVIYEPTDAIELVLRDGQAVDVEYESSDVSQIIVNGLENIFDDSTNFGSDEDLAVINAGGTIEFSMVITGLSESEVPASDLAAIQSNMAKNEVVAMYTDFSIWKRSYGAYGLISENQVTSIAGGKTVRIVLPLSSDLVAADGLSVIRVHDGTVERLVDVDNNPYTYTFESALFSTYALVYTDNSITEADSTTATSDSSGSSSGTSDSSGTTSATGSTTDISKTSNTSASVVKSSGSTTTSPTTGDSTLIVLAGIIGLLMGLAGVALIKKNEMS